MGIMLNSQLEPGATIIPHTGPSNMRLTCHLGLIGCEKVFINVNDEEREYKNNKCIIFDDSFTHGVQHKGTQRRVTFMLDFWHPEMTPVEIEAFKMVLQNSASEMDKDKFLHSLGIVDRPDI